MTDWIDEWLAASLDSPLGIVFTVAALVIGVSSVVGLLAIYRARDDASRAVVSDLVFFCAVAVFVLVASVVDSSIVFDVALLASMLGILSTLALARMLTRGRR